MAKKSKKAPAKKTKVKTAPKKKTALKAKTKVAPKRKAPAKKAVKKAVPAKKAAPKKAASKKATPKKAAKTPQPSKKVALAKPAKATAQPVAFVSPLRDQILIFRTQAANRTPGGLYIPDSVVERPNEGKVLAVGRGRVNKKGLPRHLDVQVGDSVLFSTYAGQTLEFGSLEYVLLREEEILGVVEG